MAGTNSNPAAQLANSVASFVPGMSYITSNTNLFGGNNGGGDDNTDDTPDGNDTNNKISKVTGISAIDSFLVPIFNFLNGIMKWLSGQWRKIAFPDSLTAENGMIARIDASPQFDKLVADLKLPATMTLASGQTMPTADYLRKTCENAIKNLINQGELTNNPQAAISMLTRLHTELATVIEAQLRTQYAQNPAQETALHLVDVAHRAAASITGLDLDSLAANDPKAWLLQYYQKGQLNTALAGLVLGTQHDLKIVNPPPARGTYSAASVPALTAGSDLTGAGQLDTAVKMLNDAQKKLAAAPPANQVAANTQAAAAANPNIGGATNVTAPPANVPAPPPAPRPQGIPQSALFGVG